MRRFLPFLDLRLSPGDLRADVGAALLVTVLSVPQGLAYAMIAGLPPVAGLYASIAPAVVGGLFRSSRFVVAGPTNALSLLVGASVAVVAARTGESPAALALTLALLVGGLQLLAGLLRLGGLVDYLSSPVVLGYVTGAGVLIGLGQLGNLTGTPMTGATLPAQVASWVGGLGAANPWSLGVGLGTLGVVALLRGVAPRVPGPLVAMVLALVASHALHLGDHGVRVIADLAPVPAGLPPWTVPSFHALLPLLPAAVATTVLSLVESTAVARSLAARTGDRLDASVEFAGQGLANLAAAFTGGYPVSGSLGRSSASWRAGARTRLAGVLGGLLVLLVVLVAGPVVDATPIASLAGLLLVLAWDLVDRPGIRRVVASGRGDVAAFLVTLVGAWVLHLDQAIYLGVGVSLVLFLRRARQLTAAELVVDDEGHLRETPLPGDEDELPAGPPGRRCSAIRVLHVEGSLFFGAAGELQELLDDVGPEPRVVVLRLKRCRGLDLTTAEVLRSAAERLRREGRTLLLAGMRPEVVTRMESLGLPEAVGRDNLFPTEPGWFAAMDAALARAASLVGPHEDDCPFEAYRRGR